MKAVEEVVACVVDHGMFMPVAEKLAETMAKVYYHTPWEKGFATINDCTLGDGVERLYRCDDFLTPRRFNEIDLFVFPNIMHGGLQEHLVASGKMVWGSRRADSLELDKAKFYRVLKEIGLAVPKYTTIKGLSALCIHLAEHDDLYIKISKYRETMDTWHHVDWAHSEGRLDQLACRLGPFKEEITFFVIDPIVTKIEGGIDTYCIDGKWPSHAVLGYERKNEAYLATVRPMAEMPPQFKMVNDAMGAVLGRYQYRNFFSTEVRVAQDDTAYFIDPTCRTPSPAGEEQLELYGNFAEIVWLGAHGELVEPDIVAEFAGESLIHHTDDKCMWRSLTVPPEVRQWVKLYGCAEVNGTSWWPPGEEDCVGCVVGIGKDLTAVIDHIKKTVGALNEGAHGDAPIKVDFSAFPALLQAIRDAQKEGIEFSDKPVPKPESVVSGEGA